jgi:hypothetical protein
VALFKDRKERYKREQNVGRESISKANQQWDFQENNYLKPLIDVQLYSVLEM